jgi:hypothetical protein
MAERLLIRGNFSLIAYELSAVLQNFFPNRLPSDVVGPGSVKTVVRGTCRQHSKGIDSGCGFQQTATIQQ